MWQSALSLLGFTANQGSLFNKVSLFCQRAVCRVLLQRLVYPVVFVQACAQVGNGLQAITGDPVHTIQASLLTVLVLVVPQFGYILSLAS